MNKTAYYRISGLMLMISWTAFLYLNAHFLLYNDEMATMMELRMPFGDMMRFLLTEDIHLPAYYVLLKMWMFVFGDSVFSARCFSYAGPAACAFGGRILVGLLLAFSFVSQISLSKKVLNKSVQPSFYQAVKRHVMPEDVIVATDWMIAYWFYFRFPEYDVRVLPSGTERLLGKKQRRIDEAGIPELLKTKNVFVTTGVQGNTKAEELFNGFDAYMGRSFVLNKIDRAQFYGAENIRR